MVQKIHAMLSKPTDDDTEHFDGLRIDTCANRTSVIGNIQYERYCRDFGVLKEIRPSNCKWLKGLGGTRPGILGVVKLQVPFSNLNLVIDVDFSMISDEDPRDPSPTLLSMKDMLDNNIDISIEECCVKFQGLRQALTMENYFLVYRWTVKDLPYALYTASELRNIHRVFGHLSVRATTNLIKKAQGKGLSKDTQRILQSISEECTVCKYEDRKPRRFKLTVGIEGLRFNHQVQIDTIFLEGKPVLHMVDEATHFFAAEFLPT